MKPENKRKELNDSWVKYLAVAPVPISEKQEKRRNFISESLDPENNKKLSSVLKTIQLYAGLELRDINYEDLSKNQKTDINKAMSVFQKRLSDNIKNFPKIKQKETRKASLLQFKTPEGEVVVAPSGSEASDIDVAVDFYSKAYLEFMQKECKVEMDPVEIKEQIKKDLVNPERRENLINIISGMIGNGMGK